MKQKFWRRAAALALALAMMLSLLPRLALPARAASSGTCGNNLTWELSNDGVLTIRGTGAMWDWGSSWDVPWASFTSRVWSVELADGATSIGNQAFNDCSNLSSVEIPDSVKRIGKFAFDDCSNLRSVEIGDGIVSIGEYAFQDCYKLSSIEIPSSVTSIGHSAFSNCSSLSSVKIPGSVTSISSYTFKSCSSLNSVEIGNGVTKIEFEAFKDCTSLSSVFIPDSVTRIEKGVFGGCVSLTDIYYSGDQTQWSQISIYNNNDPLLAATVHYNWDHIPAPGEADCDGGAACPSAHFTDEPKPGNWAHAGVDYAVSNGLFNGMSDTTFEPGTAMTRAMLVTVLWRYAGQPVEGNNPFSDVQNGKWYTKPIAWASANGIVNGVSADRFDPMGVVTREQLATILYRYCGAKGIDNSAQTDLSGFPDVGSVSSYAKKAVSWAVAEGIIGGNKINGVTCIDPKGNATRAQVATIMMRFIENVVK